MTSTLVGVEFVYLSVLSVIQPARIQDIERMSGELHGKRGERLSATGDLRQFHDVARAEKLVISVRRGLFVLSRSGAQYIRTEPFVRTLDNRRLFLIKARRKRIL
jgi:hypothetical protein